MLGMCELIGFWVVNSACRVIIYIIFERVLYDFFKYSVQKNQFVLFYNAYLVCNAKE